MSTASLPIDGALAPATAPSRAFAADAARLRGLVDREHAFVWRSLRRFGVPVGDVDDAVQRVFLVASRRLGEVDPRRERSFLFATAMRVASNERRGRARQRSAGAQPLDALVCPAPTPEKTASDRALLDTLLEPLPLELRSVLILFELEQMTVEEIADLVDVPTGTVASRLRRARELVTAAKKRLVAREGQAP